MNLKTYTARTMAQALAQVRQQIGADAVILHTRTYHRGGILGIGARPVVEVTAVDGREYSRQRRANGGSSRSRSQQTASRSRAAPRAAAPSRHSGASDDAATDGNAGDLIRRTYAAARAEMQRDTASSAAQPSQAAATPPEQAAPSTNGATDTAANTSTTEREDQLAEEMRSMKRMVARMMGQRQRDQAPNQSAHEVPDKLFDQYLALLEQEVTEELAGEVVQSVRQTLDADQLNDAQACRKAVMDAVAGLLPTGDATQQKTAHDNHNAQPSRDGRPRTVALVGPTGVGKTTTIAKLAATFKLKQNKQVGLITMDTYRIAAVDQLKTYAGIIGVPLHVVTSPDQMHEAARQCQHCDVVLIDTAGRSQRDDPRLQELQSFLEAAQPHETHLVLSSTCTQRVLEDTIERFARISTDRIIFTKLDEAVTFGVVLNVLRKVKKRLSYVTTGQEVPHQIEPGRPDRLAALMLGESEALQATSEQ